MAEINQSSGSSSRVRIRSKKLSTRIDMTPMVDLAFLLLTFFILTTTLSKPQTMEITMPEKLKKEDVQTEVNEKKVLTIVLASDDKAFWYVGITEPRAEKVDFSKNGI